MLRFFFITGRPEDQREATNKNLAAAGYGGAERLDMVPNGARFASATYLHGATVDLLAERLVPAAKDMAIVRVQGEIRLGSRSYRSPTSLC